MKEMRAILRTGCGCERLTRVAYPPPDSVEVQVIPRGAWKIPARLVLEHGELPRTVRVRRFQLQRFVYDGVEDEIAYYDEVVE